MATHLTTHGIPTVNILIHINGQLTEPEYGYILGVLSPGTKIRISAEVVGAVEHSCYSLDSKMFVTPKAVNKLGVYEKNLTVTPSVSNDGAKTTMIAGWPNNMFVLEIKGQNYNVGIFCRNGKYFFAVHEKTNPVETNSALPVGFVTHFDPLRGIARVFTGSLFQEARLHWKNMPFRKQLGFRAVTVGEVVHFAERDLAKTGAAKTSFSEEIVGGVLVY